MAAPIKKTVKILGMTCVQCEKIIHKKLKAADGVLEADVSFQTGLLRLVYDPERIQMKGIAKIVSDAGYEIQKSAPGQAEHASHQTLSPVQLGLVAVVLLSLYLLIDKSIGFNFIPEISPSMGYGMLFAVGLLTSLHCVAMCGGINLSQCLSKPVQLGEPQVFDWRPSLYYNGGRVISYTIVGAAVGALGSAVSFSGGARGLVAVLAGGFMVIMGINMLGWFPALRRLNLQMPSGLRRRLMGKNGERGPLVVGLLNGLMPCGPLQAMQLYALGTGSALAGALSMFFFSLGTVPLMFGFGAFSTLLSKRFTRNMLKISALMVVLLGAVMMQRGFSLSGFAGFSAAQNFTQAEAPQPVSQVSVQIENGVQVVTGEVSPNAYPVVVVKKGMPVKLNLHAAEDSLNGCNRAIVIPAFDIEKDLAPGDNWVEFTPNEAGSYPYSCWMGMITSEIVVEE